MHDLLEYQIRFAKTMSKNEMTQVQYMQQGFYIKMKEQKTNRQMNFFIMMIKTELIKKILEVAHFSNKKFQIAADLYKVLVHSKNFDTQIFNIIIEILSKEENQNQDCLEFLKILKQNYAQNNNQIGNLSLLQKQKQLDAFEQTINQITRLINIIIKHDFHSINEFYTGTRQYIIQKIYQVVRIIEFLKFLVHSS
ncbi:unnamed protein product [Paramecium pentaurelia]|uniref:Uncharacterized protein n=1 Tax=Paramecium pentaurelia TaxID=43138 RepID=A0A8S1Y338_9CILI|nr:unnamed protein product [Paramecium pentaurelia]